MFAQVAAAWRHNVSQVNDQLPSMTNTCPIWETKHVLYSLPRTEICMDRLVFRLSRVFSLCAVGTLGIAFTSALATAGGADTTAYAANPLMLWADPIDPTAPAPAPQPLSDPRTAKSTPATPTHLRWAILRCNFAGSPAQIQTPAQQRRVFERPEVGVFAFFERQSRGRLSQEVAWVAEVPLPKSVGDYWNSVSGISGFLEVTTADCLDGANRNLTDITAISVVFNDVFTCCAYGSRYPLNDGTQTRSVGAIWMPPEMARRASVVAHEVAHTFGIFHSNNTDRDWDTTDSAWDLMSNHHLNAVRDSELILLPHSLHPYQRHVLGWLDADELVEVFVGEGPDRSETFVLPPGKLLRLHYDGQRGMTVHFRGVGHTDDGLRTEPAVFVNELDTGRVEPLWVVDEGVPLPNVASTDTSYFTRGESWVVEEATPGRALMVEVIGVTGEAATVRVHLGPPPPPVELFASDFEAISEGPSHAP